MISILKFNRNTLNKNISYTSRYFSTVPPILPTLINGKQAINNKDKVKFIDGSYFLNNQLRDATGESIYLSFYHNQSFDHIFFYLAEYKKKRIQDALRFDIDEVCDHR
jgi:hypothetical protein